MEKQYRVITIENKTQVIEIYHNGNLISIEEYENIVPMYVSKEFCNRLYELRDQGYLEGYTPEEVNQAKQIYKNKLKNIITPVHLPPCCWTCSSASLEPTSWDIETVHYKCLNCGSEWVRGNYPFREEED